MVKLLKYRIYFSGIAILTLLFWACSKNDDVSPPALKLNLRYNFNHLQVGDTKNQLERYVVVDQTTGAYKNISSTNIFSPDIIQSYTEFLYDRNLDGLTFYKDSTVKAEAAEKGIVVDSIIGSFQKLTAPFAVKVLLDAPSVLWFKLNDDNDLYWSNVVYFSRLQIAAPFSIKIGQLTSTTPDKSYYIKNLIETEKLKNNDTIVIGDFNVFYKF